MDPVVNTADELRTAFTSIETEEQKIVKRIDAALVRYAIYFKE